MNKAIKLFIFAVFGIQTLSFADVPQWIKLNDGDRADQYFVVKQNIFIGTKGAPPLEGVDFDSFQVLAGTDYARDKNKVYYPLAVMCVDGLDFGYSFATEYIIKGAEPGSFRYLGNDYATDGTTVFFRGEVVNGAQGKSIELVEGPEYFYCVKDSENVFMYNKILAGADSKSFHFWKKESRDPKIDMSPLYLLRDKNHVWRFDPPDLPKLIDENKKAQQENSHVPVKRAKVD